MTSLQESFFMIDLTQHIRPNSAWLANKHRA
jgi:hypothetical protein